MIEKLFVLDDWKFEAHYAIHKSGLVMWTANGFLSFGVYTMQSKTNVKLTLIERYRLWTWMKWAMLKKITK